MTTLGVYLVGFMGAGKSSVGPILARLLDRPFFDLDQVIQSQVGKTIPEIFGQEGETAFRKYEQSALAATPSHGVVALGGGAFVQEGIRQLVADRGVSIYLHWPFSVLWARIEACDQRPLAADRDAAERLWRARLPHYRSSDLVWQSQPPHEESTEETARSLWRLLTENDRLGTSFSQGGSC